MTDATSYSGFSSHPHLPPSSASSSSLLGMLPVHHRADRVTVVWQGLGAPIEQVIDGGSMDAACDSLGEILESHGWQKRITQRTAVALVIRYFHPPTQSEAFVTARLERRTAEC